MQSERESWWKRAQRDLVTAENSYHSGDYYASIFWCQQSVEKAFKALWAQEKKEEIPKYHDLLFFIKQLELPSEFKEACKELTSGYILTRYPTGLEVSFSKGTTSRLITKSTEILQWIKEKLS